MTVDEIRVSRDWLTLREPADAAARARDLVEQVTGRLPQTDRQVIHDLACGTGSMGRWLAPQLNGAQHWVVHDRDPDLLAAARADRPGPARDGGAVSLETRQSDITWLGADELDGAALIVASALLDMLTGEELARLVAVCVEASCPVLITLSVVGRVELTPADPLDLRVAAAFNDHQRRMTARGRLLGPDAVAAAGEQFRRHGAEVIVRRSPWRLGALHPGLAAEWFAGWLAAACEQQEELDASTRAYARRRLAEAGAGRLAVTLEHADLLVLPRPDRGSA